MKANTQWHNEAYDVVMDKLHDAGFVAYAVGGCVRDSVMGLPFDDVDVATNARPHDLTKVFGVRQWDGDSDVRTNADGVSLYPTGVNHGTWTVASGGDTVEVTSFRKDVATDGRNATIEFADTMEEDAQRRDFTMNALYCDRNNDIHDPTGTGLNDLMAGKVRFVGDAEERVKEDYLRILRLFRFHARFGRGPMDVEASRAVSKHAYGIQHHVSGERVWSEITKLLSLHSPFEALAEMKALLVHHKLFEKFDLNRLAGLLIQEREHNCSPSWERRYAVLCGAKITYPCSKLDAKMVADLSEALDGPTELSQKVIAHKYGYSTGHAWALCSGLRPRPTELALGVESHMPVSAQDLMDRGWKPGKELGDELRTLEMIWLRDDMTTTFDRLIEWTKRVRK